MTSNIKELHEALSNTMYWAIVMNHSSTDELRNIWRRVDAEYKNMTNLTPKDDNNLFNIG